MEGGSEEADLYESLPPTTTVGTHMLAGAMAGMGEHCVMYPFDCVKVLQHKLLILNKSEFQGGKQ